MNICPIFISSADSYSDIWPVFFKLFKMYWPDYDGVIYLNTENKDFYYEGLNIICTKVGKNKTFGVTFRAGLDKINSPYVMLMMIDYFFMGEVSSDKLELYYKYFLKEKLDTLCLVYQNYREYKSMESDDLLEVLPPSKDMFSYQIAYWKTETLYNMALPLEDPWLSEWYGTKRANIMMIKMACVKSGKNPISYLIVGALHQAKWVEEMVVFLKANNISVDFNKRGYYREEPVPFNLKLKQRIKRFYPRCISRIDLCIRYLKRFF